MSLIADGPTKNCRGLVLDEERELLHRFPVTSPELLEKRALLSRSDTKFILARDQLVPVLRRLTREYSVLLANGEPCARYFTQYFDTAERDCFHDHRRGKRVRCKVRCRHYADRRLSFLEVKQRQANGSTKKHRLAISLVPQKLSPEETAFIAQAAPNLRLPLVQTVANDFGRVTLVGIATPERATFDLSISFRHGSRQARINEVVIVEVKQARFSRFSTIIAAMREVGALPVSASKYCVGTMLLYPNIRGNRLLPTVRKMQGVHHV